MEIQSEIIISSSADRVWQVLTAFESYSEWNPILREAKGKLEVGSHLDLVIQNADGGTKRLRPEILTCTKVRELRWIDRFMIPGLFSAERIFQVKALSHDRTRLIHCELIGGVLVPFRKSYINQAKQSFEAMNLALKTRVEAMPREDIRDPKASVEKQ